MAAAYALPSNIALSPRLSTANSPPPTSSSLSPPPPPTSSPQGQPGDDTETPTPSNPSQSSSPPPASSAPPPASPPPPPPHLPTSPPPPASQPPSASPPPPSAAPPPPVSCSPPQQTMSPPPHPSSPPPSTPPPTPTLSPPPPSAIPPAVPPPPPSSPLSPLPDPVSPPPPVAIPSPSPANSQSPPPPPPAEPPIYSSPPPPLAEPPKSSPPPPVLPSPPPSEPRTPPISPAAPPLPPRPPPSPPPPRNATPSTPHMPFPTTPTGPPSSPSLPDPWRTPVTPIDPGPKNDSSPSGIATAATVAVVTGLVMLAFVGAAVWFVKKRRKPEAGPSAHPVGFPMASPAGSSPLSDSGYRRSPLNPLPNHGSGSCGFMYSTSDPGLGKLWFSFEELSAFTNSFSSQNLLGEGGFGCVYKGFLPSGREVAVKQLKVGSSQGEREFKAEVEIISRIHHRNLVSLIGYCISANHRLLVYDFVPNNTLHYHLHGKGRPVMDWTTRIKVAVGAAHGIAYLHEDCHPRIIHRDIKSSNILLNNNFEAQVSDFGLARLAMDAQTHVTTRVMGTFGYLAPEYASTGKLTAKSDVYSYGVVLLELITGRRPVDTSQPLGDESLVEWARPLLIQALEDGDFGDLPDPRLENNYNENEMLRMIETAAACTRHSAAMRPRMTQVVRALDNSADLDINNGVKPGQSEIINSAQQSEEIRIFQRMGSASQDYSNDYSQASWKSRNEL